MYQLHNPLDTIGASLAHAAYVALPDRVGEVMDGAALFAVSVKERAELRIREAKGEKVIPRKIVTWRPDIRSDCEVYAVFAQSWSSTALGFSGIGGQAITAAYTVVIKGPDNVFAIYWDAKFAYLVDLGAIAENQAEVFRADIANRTTAAVRDAEKRYGARTQATAPHSAREGA